jgi:sugar phosphate isomerase/epimerase
MKKTRRDFLRTSGMALTGISLLPTFSCSGAGGKTIALQLYSVREDMSNDPLGSLTKLAEMGYTHVEHANYVDHKFYGWTAEEFKKVLNDLGLSMPSGHTVLRATHWDKQSNDFTDEWKKLLDDAARMGQKYVISPSMENSMHETYDDFLYYMDVYNKCGELCKKSGMQFGYHNHHFEFSKILKGEKIFDLFMKNTDADKVVMQLDIGNMYIAGARAEDVLAKYPRERYVNIHIKDMIKKEGGEGYESTILGQGVINAREITDMARDMGTELFIIEQESYQGKTPMECMEENLSVVKSWGY